MAAFEIAARQQASNGLPRLTVRGICGWDLERLKAGRLL